MIDPALEAPCRLVSEKYRVRGCITAATYHKVSRFAPGRGPGWPTIGVHTRTSTYLLNLPVLQLYVPVLVRAGTAVLLSVRLSTPGRQSKTFGFDVAEGRI